MRILKQAMRRAKARLLRFRRAGPPILIMGLRRGGSTMVADAIAACRGIWIVNEPFAVLPGRAGYDVKRRRLPEVPHSHYFRLEAAELTRFEAYVEALFSAELRMLGTCRATRLGLVADRVCLKVLNAPWMLPWFSAATDARIICVLRHPAAQSLSAIRQGWRFPADAYFDRRAELADVFNADQLALWREVRASGDPWRAAVLDWTVTSAPMRESRPTGATLLFYEDIVRNPEAASETLAEACGLDDRPLILRSLVTPSGSSKMSEPETIDAIRGRNVDQLLERWRDQIDPGQARAGQEILDCFGVDEYRMAP